MGAEPFDHHPLGQISKCRCGPSEDPLEPTAAMGWPAATAWPFATSS